MPSENTIKKSFLESIIREIVKNILNEGFDLDKDNIDEESATGAVASMDSPVGLNKKKPVEEMTVTGDVAGYNVPGAFSRRGGSERGLKGSESLGYTLTDTGKKDMSRSADKLAEKSL